MYADPDNTDRSPLFARMQDPDDREDIDMALLILGVDIHAPDAEQIEPLRSLIYFLQRRQLRAEERAVYYASRKAWMERRAQEATDGKKD